MEKEYIRALELINGILDNLNKSVMVLQELNKQQGIEIELLKNRQTPQ